MKIMYKNRSLLDAGENVIVHGCNAAGVMGAGVASEIRNKWPFACTPYFEAEHHNLGEVIWGMARAQNAIDSHRFILIGHLIVQQEFGRDKNHVYVNYDAIQIAMRTLNIFMRGCDQPVAMPMIGAGLGNGDRSRIEQIIEREATRFKPIVYIRDLAVYQNVVSKNK